MGKAPKSSVAPVHHERKGGKACCYSTGNFGALFLLYHTAYSTVSTGRIRLSCCRTISGCLRVPQGASGQVPTPCDSKKYRKSLQYQDSNKTGHCDTNTLRRWAMKARGETRHDVERVFRTDYNTVQSRRRTSAHLMQSHATFYLLSCPKNP